DRDRRHAPRRERGVALLPEPSHPEPELPRAVELATGRPRDLGRALHEPPRAVRPLSAVPANAQVHREGRSPNRPRHAECAMTPSDEIRSLLFRYCEMIDGGDVDGLVELFADAVMSGFGATREWRGRDEIRAMYSTGDRRERTSGGRATKHITTNALIEVDE